MRPGPRLAFAVLLILAAMAQRAAARPGLDDAAIRAFLARQDRAWSAGDLAAYFASFAPDAVFVDQAQNPRGGVLPYGRSTLSQARAQAHRSLAAARIHQQSVLQRAERAADGRSVRVLTQDSSTIEGAGGVRRACGLGEQTLTLSGGRIVSHGQTETAVRCRR